MPEHRTIEQGADKQAGEYLGILPRYLSGAVAAATRSLQPVRIGFGRGEHQQLAWNRLHKDETVDPSVLVMRIEDASSREPIAVLINYACHAVMLGPKTAISADYPGAVRRHVEAAVLGELEPRAQASGGERGEGKGERHGREPAEREAPVPRCHDRAPAPQHLVPGLERETREQQRREDPQ